MKIKVIIPASGIGKRFGGNTPKQFFKINGKEILAHSISKFNEIKEIDEIIIASDKKNVEKIKKIIERNNFRKVSMIVAGGKQRQDSVYNALRSLSCEKNDTVMVHDAVRPYVSAKLIKELIQQAKIFKNVIPGIKINDTLKLSGKKEIIENTISRENMWTVQTPQAFNYSQLMDAFQKSIKNKFLGTDESSLMEHAGYKVKIIPGEKSNVKITVKDDIIDYF